MKINKHIKYTAPHNTPIASGLKTEILNMSNFMHTNAPYSSVLAKEWSGWIQNEK
jgi:hypothetical protein